MSAAVGFVYLIGAGPGAPDLITLRGRRLLRIADVVVHDRLVSPALLDVAGSDAVLIDVGKNPAADSTPQADINALLIEHARAGRFVVRLKGGDPLLLGRGYEEIQACSNAGIPCAVVPGISSAVAGPSAAGIPVTHRNVSRSVAVVTGRTHDDVDPLDYSALAKMDTLVVLMGYGRRVAVVDGLLRAGKPSDVPAACITRATAPGQRMVRATLSALPEVMDQAGMAPPTVIIIGPVAALHDGMPLSSRRFVMTRPRGTGTELSSALMALGAQVDDVALTRIERGSGPEFDDALNRIDTYSWLVLTSQHAVAALRTRLAERSVDARSLHNVRIAAVGPRTTRALGRLGLRPDVVPAANDAAGLVAAIATAHDLSGCRVLYPCSARAATTLRDGLCQAGAIVDPVVVYDTVAETIDRSAWSQLEPYDSVLLYSPSAARALAELDSSASCVCVGPTTARAATALGLQVKAMATVPSTPEMVATIMRCFGTT